MSASSIRTLVVDDEPLARRGLRARLAGVTDVDVVGECASGRAAVDEIRSLTPDLVLLDVQMPEVDGFEVIELVGPARMPNVIFVTAFDAYALRAFAAHAIDYLLKPIDDARFADALDRVRQRMRDRDAGALARQLASLLAAVGTATERMARIAVHDRGRVVLLDPDEIAWVGADGDYVRVHANGQRYLVRETLGAMEARLPSHQFVRIQRSTIVNVGRIGVLEPLPNREFLVRLRDGTQLRASRTYD
ncbi:MAG: LytR/AlgR family response regulator transcription factor, partial [Gemmatimonadales bacterium]